MLCAPRGGTVSSFHAPLMEQHGRGRIERSCGREKLELRTITKSQRMRDSAVMISSTMPSAKYSCSGSPLRLAKGKTAIDGLSGRGNG